MIKNYLPNSDKKMTCMIMLMLSITMSLFTKNLFSLWVLFEINSLMFIIIMQNNNNLSTNSMIKYFIFQTIPSMIFLLSFSAMFLKSLFYWSTVLIFLSMIMKLGLVPFHIWLSDIIESLDWNNFIIFNTLQKFLPLFVLNKIFLPSNIIDLVILASAFFSSWIMFYQTSLRKLLTFSSIIHMSWMMYIMNMKSYFWMVYFLFYNISFWLFYLIKNINININLLMNMNNLENNIKINMSLVILNFSSLPPLPMFLFKMTLLASFFNFTTYNMLMIICLMLASFLSCFIYIRMILPTFSFKIKTKIYNIFYKNMNMLYMLIFMLFTMMNLYLYL